MKTMRLFKKQISICAFGGIVLFALWNYAKTRQNHAIVKLVIFAYMRSGSSLTGSIYDSHPDVFYSYESLMPLYSSTRQEMHFIMKSSRTKKKYCIEATRIVHATLNCNFEELDTDSLSNYHSRLSEDTNPYFKCIDKHYDNLSTQVIMDCLPLLNSKCLEKSVRVAKEIRLPIESMEQLLETDRAVKMIHLLRDPRAMIISQMKYGNSDSTSVYPYALTTCALLRQDIDVRKSLQFKYPGRIKVIFYEDLARYPVKVAESLFIFSGLKFSKESSDFVKSITSAKSSQDCVLCIQKSDSALESEKWRRSIGYDVVSDIDDACGGVYKELGYKIVSSEHQLKNSSEQLRIQQYFS